MRITILLLTILVLGCNPKPKVLPSNNVITTDVDNFWMAYDKVVASTDSLEQKTLLETHFMEKASAGQKAMFAARNYTSDEYLFAINNYPKFWASVRNNTEEAKTLSADLNAGIAQLKKIYPDLKPAKIYFTIGALRSNGTTMDSLVLIGSELAFANPTTETSEFPERLSHLKAFFESNPKENLVFLNIHEYVHTQQKTTIGYNLLAQTVIEGVAEFLTEVALERPSPNPQIGFGRKQDAKIKAAFSREMFSPNFYNWLWNSPDNEFGMRDLAYYVGYKISEGYYNQAKDKQAAIKAMIQLDYNDETALLDFVDAAKYFEAAASSYKAAFEKSRPTVSRVLELKDANTAISHKTKIITVEFSEPMNTQRISTDLGESGIEHFPKIEKVVFSEDGKQLYYHVLLESQKNYEMVLHWNMRSQKGIPLVPYTIKFTTD